MLRSLSRLHVLIIVPFGFGVNRFRLLLSNQFPLFFHNFELSLHIVSNQTTLDHRYQVAVILWYDETVRTLTPGSCLNEGMIEPTVRLVGGIKDYERPS